MQCRYITEIWRKGQLRRRPGIASGDSPGQDSKQDAMTGRQSGVVVIRGAASIAA